MLPGWKVGRVGGPEEFAADLEIFCTRFKKKKKRNVSNIHMTQILAQRRVTREENDVIRRDTIKKRHVTNNTPNFPFRVEFFIAERHLGDITLIK